MIRDQNKHGRQEDKCLLREMIHGKAPVTVKWSESKINVCILFWKKIDDLESHLTVALMGFTAVASLVSWGQAGLTESYSHSGKL